MVDRETEMRQKKKAKEKETRNRGRKRFIWNSLSGAKTERDLSVLNLVRPDGGFI